MIGEKIIDKLIEENGKIDIAFCPYCWQMWDSMKSVYDAAVERGLDASICPVPYYVKDSKGNFDHWVNSPDDYRIPESDYIVTHNPFDNCNLITSVHTDFYSENLKRCGKTIIYIPYYTGQTTRGVLNSPVVRNADYIFCADETDREEFWKLYPDKKIYAYGSPKRDMMQGRHGNRTILCSSLMPVIYEPLERIETYKKILSKGNIIFRPHPLTVSGLNAMNPEHVNDWLDFIYDVKILDNSTDLEKSLLKCKKLYTDSPSIVELWQETGLDYEWI